MLFDVQVTGRRISDNLEYKLDVQRDARSPEEAIKLVENDYDWDDAATRAVIAVPAMPKPQLQ